MTKVATHSILDLFDLYTLAVLCLNPSLKEHTSLNWQADEAPRLIYLDNRG